MARIRSIKPDFWVDEAVGLLSRDARLLFIATWNMADDEGRLRWNAAYLKSQAFTYDDDLDIEAVTALMDELTDAVFVKPYRGGKTAQWYAVIPSFKSHQKPNRPQESRLPEPPASLSESFTESRSESLTESFTAVEESRGEESRGVVVTPSPSTSEPSRALVRVESEFEQFWDFYPRKIGKRTALTAWQRAIKRTDPERILAGVTNWLPTWSRGDPKFIPHPTTWLNRDGWLDQPPPPTSGLNPSLQAVLAHAQQRKAQA